MGSSQSVALNLRWLAGVLGAWGGGGQAVAEWAGAGCSQGSVTFERHAAHAPKGSARSYHFHWNKLILQYGCVCAALMSLFAISCRIGECVSLSFFLSQWDIFCHYV